ncbi:MAG TPA: AbrB/MazE/SpoVT family DNA-binding domain-containing protein [Thermoanaerobaculia bacterium]|nr:AbrB/MazE/SpoVT family DNA-binding domain-containing protein [Thermoanaerobaculia bacterium]
MHRDGPVGVKARWITLSVSIDGSRDEMARTRVSPKYQVVIPKEVRERHGLKPGQEMQVISKGNIITLIPDRPLSAFRGILRGMPTTGHREKKDRT